MKNIFRNLKDQWYLVLLIVVLLVIQANCDLALPDYTSKIIDVGIQNQGMEHCVPERIRKSEHAMVGMFLSEQEKEDWNAIYQETSEDGDILVLSIKDEGKEDSSDDNLTWDEADQQFRMALIMNLSMSKLQKDDVESMMSSESSSLFENVDVTNKEVMAQMASMAETIKNSLVYNDVTEIDSDGNETIVTYVDARPVFLYLNELGMLPEATFDAMKEEMQKQVDVVGDTMLNSMAISYAIDEYQAAGGDLEALQRKYLISMGAKMLGLTLVMAIMSIVTGLFAAQIGGKVGMRLRKQIFEKVVTFTGEEMDKFSTASLITRSTNDVQQVQFVTTVMLRMMIYAPIIGIGGIIHVIQTGAKMEWLIIVTVIWLFVLIGILMLIAMPKFQLMQEKIDGMNLVSREILTGLLVIRAFVREDTEEERFEEANHELMKTMLFTNRVMTFLLPVMMITMNVLSIGIVWIGAKRIDAGVMQVGTMTAFITYAMIIVMSFLIICMFSIMIPRAGIAAGRIQEVLNTEVSVRDAEDAVTLSKEQCKGLVEFHNVNFKYPGAEENVLENIDFVAKAGETTAIIGSTGCGKSTLIHLLPRFYDVTEGSITIDGQDIRQVTQSSLRELIGFVPQKGVLFSGTIASNISFGAEDAEHDELVAAAKIAQADSFIDEKTDKYESSISQGGSNVSGGQKQRLSIARAIAKKPKIFIFDDSFSALDFKTDAALRKALGENVKDATVIIVAQRISTILHADQILVLDDGKIVGKGTHDELLASCEVYQQIAKSQLSEKELVHDNQKEDTKHE